ncbi:MAG: choline/ethanolamine kinase family protein [Nocardioidaceae bacterium]
MADGGSPRVDVPPLQSAVAAALARLDCLGTGPRSVLLLAGGLTNTNVRVTTPTRDVVVRISEKDSAILAIDRDAEYANSRAAAEAGAAPAVVDYDPDAHLLVVEYVAGRTLSDADLQGEDMLRRVAAACRRLHAGPRFVSDFDMFEVQRGYLDTVVEKGFRLPPGYLDLMPQVSRIHAALSAYPLETVPCNNDLLPANFIDDGERIWVIDYEYAGNNDPCFELGNIWSEATLPLDHLDVLVAAYFGEDRPELTARARLYGLMSKYGWTLWASIQDATSTQDFDFWDWGMQKYDRAVAEFDGPDFERLLDAAARHTGGIPCPTPRS